MRSSKTTSYWWLLMRDRATSPLLAFSTWCPSRSSVSPDQRIPCYESLYAYTYCRRDTCQLQNDIRVVHYQHVWIVDRASGQPISNGLVVLISVAVYATLAVRAAQLYIPHMIMLPLSVHIHSLRHVHVRTMACINISIPVRGALEKPFEVFRQTRQQSRFNRDDVVHQQFPRRIHDI